ncbi:Uncharacterised protein [uncultured archaeon]|nr:Uncharacterised protein [uncultured archaeon]
MNEIDAYRDLVNQCRLPVTPTDNGFKVEFGDFRMFASRMSSESCWLSYADSSVQIDINVCKGVAGLMYVVMKGYFAPASSCLRRSKNPLAKKVLENFRTGFTKLPGNEQYAALSRVQVIDSIDSAVALIREQIEFKEIICTR